MTSIYKPKENTTFVVERWEPAQWLARRAEWSALVGQSRADRLFMSWEWQTSWWRSYAHELGAELFLVALRDSQGALVGAAPLYESTVRRRGLTLRSLQFVGTAFRNNSPVPSEHLDFVAIEGRYECVAQALLAALSAATQWDEFVAVCVRGDSALPQLIKAENQGLSFQREIDLDRSYRINLSGGIERYLVTLSESARRRLWNMRGRLQKLGAVSLRELTLVELPHALATLNALHERRWRRQLFHGRTLDFHLMLGEAMAGRRALALSALELDGRIVSIFYDYRIDSRQYNLQMGYDESVDRSVSLGLLHLGFVLQKCAEEGVSSYELLCGTGRSTDYKRRIATESTGVASVQWWRGKAAIVGRGYALATAARRSLFGSE